MGEVSLIIYVCNGSNTTLIRHPLLSKAIEIFIEKWRYCIEYLFFGLNLSTIWLWWKVFFLALGNVRFEPEAKTMDT
jgi:hypothetical protein